MTWVIQQVWHKWKGTSLLISGSILVKAHEESVIQVFIDSRNEEYREVIEKCEDYFKEIEFEIGRENFIFAEVEENEEELEKLKQWLKKVEKRDIMKPPLRPGKYFPYGHLIHDVIPQCKMLPVPRLEEQSRRTPARERLPAWLWPTAGCTI